MGRRDRSKLERLRRIEQAARSVFEEKGFDRATTREIAERADVAPATLFAYATEKRELLLMLYRDDLWTLNETAFASLPHDAPLLAQLEHLFRPRYVFWVAHPGLSRHVVREFARERSDGERAPAAEEGIRDAFLALRERVALVIAAHQTRGTFERAIDARDAARLIMHVYLCEQRLWIDGIAPDVDTGIVTLLAYLALLLRGFATQGTID